MLKHMEDRKVIETARRSLCKSTETCGVHGQGLPKAGSAKPTAEMGKGLMSWAVHSSPSFVTLKAHFSSACICWNLPHSCQEKDAHEEFRSFAFTPSIWYSKNDDSVKLLKQGKEITAKVELSRYYLWSSLFPKPFVRKSASQQASIPPMEYHTHKKKWIPFFIFESLLHNGLVTDKTKSFSVF